MRKSWSLFGNRGGGHREKKGLRRREGRSVEVFVGEGFEGR